VPATMTRHELPVVWADRTFPACPRCGEEIAYAVTDCPVTMDDTGEAEEYSQQHGCGEWLAVPWAVADDASPAAIQAAAAALAATRAAELGRARDEIRARLLRELDAAKRELDAPLEIDGETRAEREDRVYTGSDADPGVYWDSLMDGGTLLAWDFDPGSPEDTITVAAADLPAGPR
ncbi:MAG TPA: hypothetical protein VK586_16000, partial [Streptosporangiaceae bacterium]|nr:hypothetical protein [Streptosporangiaceae bacterium]